MDTQLKDPVMQMFVQCEMIDVQSTAVGQATWLISTQLASECPVCGETANIDLLTDGALFWRHCNHCSSDYAGIEEMKMARNK